MHGTIYTCICSTFCWDYCLLEVIRASTDWKDTWWPERTFRSYLFVLCVYIFTKCIDTQGCYLLPTPNTYPYMFFQSMQKPFSNILIAQLLSIIHCLLFSYILHRRKALFVVCFIFLQVLWKTNTLVCLSGKAHPRRNFALEGQWSLQKFLVLFRFNSRGLYLSWWKLKNTTII